jgi:phospholipid/cholesterol/gamma-HCH transport system substrate-binding protein
MATETSGRVKLGIFVVACTAVLLLGLYLLGSKQDLFSHTIRVSATFQEVSGLRSGDNVRYAGIDVGRVKSIAIVNDTSVTVDMIIRLDAAAHIHANALARIGSDGLMGNKLVSIEPGEGTAAPIMEGSVLQSGRVLDTDAMLRTLSRSNDNLAAITSDLRQLTQRISSNNGLLTLLSDSTLANNVHATLNDLRASASNARDITEKVDAVVQDVRAGKGAIGSLINDPATEDQVRRLLVNLQNVSDSLNFITGRIGTFSTGLNDPRGLGHTLTQDTVLANDVRRMINNLDSSSATLNEDLKALQSNWFFRKYFKQKAKETKETTEKP